VAAPWIPGEAAGGPASRPRVLDYGTEDRDHPEGAPVTSSERPESPDDHKRFSLNEDWIATIVGLVIFGLCMVGAITPGMIP
jgi:hypothetical protein